MHVDDILGYFRKSFALYGINLAVVSLKFQNRTHKLLILEFVIGLFGSLSRNRGPKTFLSYLWLLNWDFILLNKLRFKFHSDVFDSVIQTDTLVLVIFALGLVNRVCFLLKFP